MTIPQRFSYFCSRYRPRYIRSLVYMLQASEYNIRDYLKWYHRTQDFAHVERRKHLVKTAKAKLLLITGWALLVMLWSFVIFLLWFGNTPYWDLAALALILLGPSLAAYLIIVPLALARFFIQRPVEYFLLKQTQKQLAGHKAIKIAIAGSFGKTSMREMLKTVLSQGQKVAAPPHSFNRLLGIRQFVKSIEGDEKILLFEFGEYYPGDIRVLCRLVDPQWGVITGVNEAHLEKFKNLDRTAREIFELADWLGTKPLYVNGESGLARKRARAGDLIYSRSGVGSWKVRDAHSDLTGTSFVLIKGGVVLRLHSGLLGVHQIGPLAAAADMAFQLGLSPQEIERGIAAVKSFEHRFEKKVDAAGVITLDDSYNGNPDGVKAVIEFLAALKGHRRFYVTPGLVEMGAASEEVHKEIGTLLAASHIEKVVLIKNSVTPYIAQGLHKAHYNGEILWFDDALAAFAALPHLTVKGDVVLLQNDWSDQYA